MGLCLRELDNCRYEVRSKPKDSASPDSQTFAPTLAQEKEPYPE